MNEVPPLARITQRVKNTVSPFRTATDSDVDDENFVASLKRLTELRYFLLQEAVRIPPGKNASIALSDLNPLRLHKDGRRPTADEWVALEANADRLFGALTEPLRRKFIVGRTSWWISGLSIGF